ncbi:MAG: SulP family inorganic anion transporter [Motiliproteus sp.]|nr:SulP family inorganic anion transporter [Motiliproteus sp.]
MASIQGIDFQRLRGDLYGGLTAAVVALPLALAFGVSSGVGPIAGLYGAIFVGFFASLFGGTPAQVSGPTGPMTVVMALVFTEYVGRDPETGPLLAFTVVVLSGLIQIGFGLLRLGKYITMVPFPVISGFMTGIGSIIILLQLAPLFGHDPLSSALAAFQAIPEIVASPNLMALLLGSLTLIILYFWPKRWSRLIPSPLVALLVCTPAYLILFPQSELAVIGQIPSGFPQLMLPTFDPDLVADMLKSAVMLAALGTIDSLLTSLVADNLTKTSHDSDRELVGQGIGNTVAGLFGGLPGAGATMRTVVNIRAGGQSRLSGMIHALVLLIVVLGAGPLAENIPHAVLAGILIKVGIDIIDWDFLRRLHRAPPFVVILMLLVLSLTVFVDLITAVLVGVFLANIYTVKRLSDVQLQEARVVSADDEQLSAEERKIYASLSDEVLLFCLSGPVSFGAAKQIEKRLAASRVHDALLLDLSRVPYIDVSTAFAIEGMIRNARESRRQVYLIGLTPLVSEVLERMRVLQLLNQQHVVEDRLSALQAVKLSIKSPATD